MTVLNGKLVVITGATGGFGAQMVRQFQAAGSRLVITDRDRAALEALDAQYAETDGRIDATIAVDLATAAGCRRLCDALEARSLAPDILINNAGIAVAGRLDHVPADRWETLINVNLLAPMRLTAFLLPQMIARRSGHIVNVSSLAGWIGSPNLSAYCASKFGLRGFGEALALELEEHGVRVSTVYPSFSRTPILDSEQFGFDERRVVPDKLLSEPADVVARIIAGVRADKPHIFPDATSRVVHYLARYLPFTIPVLQRRLERATRRSG